MDDASICSAVSPIMVRPSSATWNTLPLHVPVWDSRHDLREIISADTDFDGLRDLRRIDPADIDALAGLAEDA